MQGEIMVTLNLSQIGFMSKRSDASSEQIKALSLNFLN